MKNVLITGGARGIGKELIEVYYANNYNVFSVVRKQEDAEELNREFKNNFTPIVTDLTDDKCIINFVASSSKLPLRSRKFPVTSLLLGTISKYIYLLALALRTECIKIIYIANWLVYNIKYYLSEEVLWKR